MEIIVDDRENIKFKNLLKKYIDFKIARLDYGDILIKDKEKKIIIERKTISDLSSSIMDNRSKKQASYLDDARKMTNTYVYYLIEHKKRTKFDLDIDTIYQTFVNKQFRDGFRIIRTKSMFDTVIYIKHILKCVNQYGIGFQEISPEFRLKKTMGYTQKKKLKQSSALIKMLNSIVPYNVAKAIGDNFKNMTELINVLYNNKYALVGIRITEKRKIGKITSEKIYNAVLM